jgi:ATP-dependent Clp protease ATP-binding subunit ClpA
MAKANALAAGQKEAFILPEHIFLGIAPDGVAAAAVQKLGSRLETLQAQIRQSLSARQGEPEPSPKASNVIESAVRSAISLHHDYIPFMPGRSRKPRPIAPPEQGHDL